MTLYARRAGFSLVEMMVAMAVTLIVFAITLPFVRAQTRSLGSTAGRLDADQVARFAMRAVAADLRQAVGESGQPTLVAAGPILLSFNANIRRADSLDVGAFDDEVIGHAGGSSWPLARAAALPLTARTYPVADYVSAAGDTSRTETITYYLEWDSTATVADTYAMYRQFNDQAPTRLITGLYLPDTQPFFTYYRNVNSRLQEIPEDTVIFWDSARMAEVRTVGFRASGIYVNRFDGSEFVRTIETRVTLPLALATATSPCGAAPTAPTAGLSAVLTASGPRGVALGWNKSTEDTGEPDGALTYVVERQPTAGAWSAVGTLAAVDAVSYSWTDYHPSGSGTYAYRVRVLGCGGTTSAPATLGSVTLP